jgi:hypothetical protein
LLIQQGLHRLTKKIIKKKIKMKSWNYMNQYNHRIRTQLEKRKKKRITRVLIFSNFIDGKSHVRILAFPSSFTPSSRRCIGLLGVLFYFSKKKNRKWTLCLEDVFLQIEKRRKGFFHFSISILEVGKRFSFTEALFWKILLCTSN